MTKKKIAILGASYLQKPLIIKAKEMGLETHVFAWRVGNVVEDICDYYYDISILDKENILEKCRAINVDGIVSIASDIAMPAVNYVANKMGLVGNSLESTLISTDKYEMRKALQKAGIDCPKFRFYDSPTYEYDDFFQFPVIVKPTDRSGSRGVTKAENQDDINPAIERALKESIAGRVIVEEFISGKEYSVEMISSNGVHHHLAVTEKVTTGAPYFVEKGDIQPADLPTEIEEKVVAEVKKTLNALGIEFGASHTELIIEPNGTPRIVESAGRMGGDFIGSHLVELSTGYDFVKGTIQVSLGIFDDSKMPKLEKKGYVIVDYLFPQAGTVTSIKNLSSQYLEIRHSEVFVNAGDNILHPIDSSNKRAAAIVYFANSIHNRKSIENVIQIQVKA
jgi:biotin carboxylase